MSRGIVAIAILSLCTSLADAQPAPVRVVRAFGGPEERLALSPEVVTDSRDGTLRLAHSVLVADEMGATDFHQTETIGDRVCARKVFMLDQPQATSAAVLFYGSAAHVAVNGKPAGKSATVPSTGWTQVIVPAGLLRAGANEVVFHGPGSLLIEACRQPGHSFRSTDAGRTWSNERLGAGAGQTGEYVARLRLGRYAERGHVRSRVFDLWSPRPGEVAAPATLVACAAPNDLQRGQPEGTRLVPWLRTGSTPTPGTSGWTDWIAFDRDYRPTGPAAHHRWAQLRFDLLSTHPQATPRLAARFDLTFEIRPDAPPSTDRLQVTASESGPWLRGAVPFVYQEPSSRLALLRQRYELDKVIAPGRTEMEQLMLLRYWVRNQWHSAWGSHPAAWMPPWDALMILEAKDQPDCLTMCTHYAAVFTQCCLALGWNARHCILDHHCVAEVYVGEHQKWVMMDAGNSAERADVGLHFERTGVPQSARELQLAWRTGNIDGLQVCFTPAKLAEQIAIRCRPAPAPKSPRPPRPDAMPAADLPKYPVCGLENYRRYALPPRNNYLSSLLPGELYQGWSHYFYDGYWWVGDAPDEPALAPEYSRHLPSDRADDIDWPLNRTRIHLARTPVPGELRVQLETITPNLHRLETATADAWTPAAEAFTWKLKPGDNVLRARAVNHFGKPGSVAEVRVRWAPSGP
jgi:hypothetical protein